MAIYLPVNEQRLGWIHIGDWDKDSRGRTRLGGKRKLRSGVTKLADRRDRMKDGGDTNCFEMIQRRGYSDSVSKDLAIMTGDAPTPIGCHSGSYLSAYYTVYLARHVLV